MSRRTLQVGELLREELTDIIRREVKDPRLGFWSITRVEVPPDLRSARVFVSVLAPTRSGRGRCGRSRRRPASSATT
jgi:ribosome-binding factor A